jgi:asparagine synthase (glutamine-hydrolysing)
LRAAVLGGTLAQTGIFEPAALERLVDQHQRGVRDHSPALWALLMFEGFCRRVLNGDSAMTAAAA